MQKRRYLSVYSIVLEDWAEFDTSTRKNQTHAPVGDSLTNVYTVVGLETKGELSRAPQKHDSELSTTQRLFLPEKERLLNGHIANRSSVKAYSGAAMDVVHVFTSEFNSVSRIRRRAMAQLLPSEYTSFTLDNIGRYLCNDLQH